MKSLTLTTALCLSLSVAAPAFAQDDDEGGFLSNKIEESLSGNGRTVKITGFKGALSSTATMEKLTVADRDGVWLILEGATMTWRRAALLKGNVVVEEMTADRVEVVRKPIAAPSEAPTAEAKEFALPNLPVSIDIGNVSVPEVILGEDILGMPLEISLDASALLVDGSGHAKFAAKRTDDSDGVFEFDGGFTADTQTVDVALDFQEAENGILAQLLKVPDRPALEASIEGHGPLADFVADFFLASDGAKRIEGTVELRQEPYSNGPKSVATQGEGSDETAEQTATSQLFKLDMGGDITALFAQEYRSFFGPDLSLQLEGQRAPDGALDLDDFSIKAETIDLAGRARLSAQMWPTVLDVRGSIKSSDGTAVLLPLSGPQTRVDSINLVVSHDAHKGSGWHANFGVVGLEQEEISLDAASLSVAGKLEASLEALKGISADVKFKTDGLSFADEAFSQAIGNAHTGRAHIEFRPDTPIAVHDVSVQGKGLSFRGDFDIGDFAEGLPTTLKAALTASDISQFAAIANRPLSGGANLSVSGKATPLSGMFDLIIQGETDDLAVGIEQADPLISGVGHIYLDVARDLEGTTVREVKVTTPEVTAVAHAKAGSGAVTFDYDAKLRDLGLIVPQYPGPVTAKGEATQTPEGIVLDTTLDAPLDTHAKASGLVTGPNANITFDARLGEFGAIVAALPGTVQLAGDLKKQGADWHVETSLEGSMGISANVGGLVLENKELDLAVTGQAPLGLAGPFIVPHTIDGTAQFDLSVNGAPSLNAVSGQITVANSNVTVPEIQATLRGINAQISLQDSYANIDATAQLSSGGTFAINGGMSLVPGYDADIGLALQSIVLEDPTLYTTLINGDLKVAGPLTGGALISGLLNIGKTTISIPTGSVATATPIPNMEHISPSSAVRQTLDRAGLSPKAEAEKTSKGGGPSYGLDMTISAPRQIFIRGRGLDAEMGGEVKLAGTTTNIASTGSLELVRGRIRVLEKRFELTDGRILLEGTLDPRLDLRATTPVPDGEASIVIGGFVSDPEITFESDPVVAEDQVLALIFFGENIEDLSTFQTLQLASAVATLAGKGGTGLISKLRSTLPVDDFELDADEDGNATVRVGKHLTDTIYSGLAVNSEGDTEISLNLDLTSKLTATGTSSSDGSSSIGVFYNSDY